MKAVRSFILDAATQGRDTIRRIFASSSSRQILVSISSLAVGGLISVGLRFIGGLIQGRFVGPETLGYYVKFTILPSYLFFLHLGVFTSLARQYPYYIGKRDRTKALSYAANALNWTYLLCFLHAALFSLIALFVALHGDWHAALGWATQSVVSVATLYMFYLGCTYRNSSEFVTWSKASIVSAVASLLFLPLVAVHQFVGICVRYSLPNFISMLYAHQRRPLRVRPSLDRTILRKMIAFGAPLMVFAYIQNQLWLATERTYVLKMLDEKSLGVFAFAFMLCVPLTTVATSISQVFHPRIAMLYGSSNKSMTTSFRYSMKCSLAGLCAMLPLVLGMFWLIDPFVKCFLPKYTESILITQYLCWLSLIPVIDLPKQLLIVAKRTKEYALAVITSFASFLVLLAIFSEVKGLMLHYIVIVSVACKLVSVVISIGLAWRLARHESQVEQTRAASVVTFPLQALSPLLSTGQED